MGCEKFFGPLTAVVLSTVLSAGCYSTAQLRVQVQVPSTSSGVTCVHATDRVFADAGFERVRTVVGPDMFYTPRTNPGATVPLGWGIGAWLDHDNPGACALVIEAISADPAPHRAMKPYSTQRGEPFDEAVRDMARRLQLASAAGS